jgi:hypothetical protein
MARPLAWVSWGLAAWLAARVTLSEQWGAGGPTRLEFVGKMIVTGDSSDASSAQGSQRTKDRNVLRGWFDFR